MPLVSVLLPAFNAAATLNAALASVRRQTLRDWECLVVDDGSSDATAAIATAVAAQDPRVRVLPRSHAGIVASLQAGLAACRGALVARMDADDLMHRERLAVQAAALAADPTIAGVGCHVRIFPRRRVTAGMAAYEAWLNSIVTADDVAREAFVECPVAHPTLMLRREVLEAHGYRDCGWPEDYDGVLRLLAAGLRLANAPRRLLSWRDHPERLSRRGEHCSIDSFTRCKAAYLAMDFLGAHETYVLWGFGGTGKALRRALARHDRLPSHIIELHPRRLGERIQGAPVVPPERLRDIAPARIVVSVAGAVPRGEIRAFLTEMGFRERSDYVCAA